MSYRPIWKDWDKWKDPQYQFNRLVRDPFFPDVEELDWNDYGSVKKWSNQPFVGGFFNARKSELEDEENERYWEDKARVNGFDLDDIKYPIRAGLYGSGISSGGFEATRSVIGLYDDLKRWF